MFTGELLAFPVIWMLPWVMPKASPVMLMRTVTTAGVWSLLWVTTTYGKPPVAFTAIGILLGPLLVTVKVCAGGAVPGPGTVKLNWLEETLKVTWPTAVSVTGIVTGAAAVARIVMLPWKTPAVVTTAGSTNTWSEAGVVLVFRPMTCSQLPPVLLTETFSPESVPPPEPMFTPNAPTEQAAPTWQVNAIWVGVTVIGPALRIVSVYWRCAVWPNVSAACSVNT